MKCLMVAFAFVLPYHAMRTATAAGHTVHVLGSGPSRGLRWSRHCASYRESRFPPGGEDLRPILDDIRDVVRQHGIEIILPSDDVSTRLLARLRNDLPTPTSLLPDVATFDLLNDKWSFTRFCLKHGVRAPQGWLYRDAAALRAALDSGARPLPITVKPISCSGGIGVIHLREPGDLTLLDAIDYRPILVQRHIPGETIGISVVCRQGEILAHATQRRDDHRFELFADSDLLCNVARLVTHTRYTGPANFDAVIEEGTGLSYIVECNPRFWYTIYMSMILGVNFVDAAIRGGAAAPPLGDRVRLSFADILRHPRRANRLDWQMLRYHLSDPVPYVLQRGGWFDDREVRVQPEEMATCTAHPQQHLPSSRGTPAAAPGLVQEAARAQA